MKKVSVLFTVFVLYMSHANAQNAIGVKGGVNFANLSGFNGKSRISAHAGVFLHHTVNTNWCFQPELIYSGEGQRYINNTGNERTLSLGYIQLPLMIQYYPVSQFYIEAGPQIGLLVSAEDKQDGTMGHANVKDDFSTGEVALAVGAGIKLTDQVIVYGRYNFGLTDATVFDNVVDHSQVGQIGVAVRFNH